MKIDLNVAIVESDDVIMVRKIVGCKNKVWSILHHLFGVGHVLYGLEIYPKKKRTEFSIMHKLVGSYVFII